MGTPEAQGKHRTDCNHWTKGAVRKTCATANVRFGSEANICSAKRHVRFTPERDRKSGLQQTVMSTLPPKADMCGAMAHVCFGPIADNSLRRRRSNFTLDAFEESAQNSLPMTRSTE